MCFRDFQKSIQLPMLPQQMWYPIRNLWMNPIRDLWMNLLRGCLHIAEAMVIRIAE